MKINKIVLINFIIISLSIKPMEEDNDFTFNSKLIDSINIDFIMNQEIKRKKKYICKQCGEYFLKVDLLRHINSRHKDITYTCEECGEKYSLKNDFNKHLNDAHKELIYKCKKCNSKYCLKKKLVNHINKVHVDRYACDQCGEKFALIKDLQKHVNRMHLDKRFICKSCNKPYKFLGSLSRHMNKKHGQQVGNTKENQV